MKFSLFSFLKCVFRNIKVIVSTYAPQVNNSMEEKNDFWQDWDGLIESISKQERIVIGADLNEHVGERNIGNEKLMKGMVREQEIRKDRRLWTLPRGWIWRLSKLISRNTNAG